MNIFLERKFRSRYAIALRYLPKLMALLNVRSIFKQKSMENHMQMIGRIISVYACRCMQQNNNEIHIRKKSNKNRK